ncbi:hypothetical protein SASPL_104564 [Salvia splendens]|uniref:Transcription initiation factor IIA subunit 2 n=1 Tax=Salvia splendens TaxID=180675 RepID=A0A8X8YHR1_SALSN|nr:hypothetical protein SASPL_104564 [Salvia splendens]
MATFELYRRSTIGMCLTETLDHMVSTGVLSPELAIQVLIQFDKVICFLVNMIIYDTGGLFSTDLGSYSWLLIQLSDKSSALELYLMLLIRLQSMTEALETEVKNKVSIKGHLHTYRFCDNVWTFILQNAQVKSEEGQETVDCLKIVACDSKLLTQ